MSRPPLLGVVAAAATRRDAVIDNEAERMRVAQTQVDPAAAEHARLASFDSLRDESARAVADRFGCKRHGGYPSCRTKRPTIKARSSEPVSWMIRKRVPVRSWLQIAVLTVSAAL